MARCGCNGSCSCKLIAGRGAQVTGSGSISDPYVISSFPMSLSVLDTPTVNLTLTGDGSQGNPWTISGVASGSAYDSKWVRWSGTQSEYDALGSYDGSTLYLITGP